MAARYPENYLAMAVCPVRFLYLLTIPPYSGDYEVVPNAFSAQVLPTANKSLMQDVVVQKVPYYETSNVQQGITVYIAGEEN